MQQVAQCFDVTDEVRGRVVGNLAVRSRATGAALIEQDDPVRLRVEEAAVLRLGAAARPAVDEENGLPLRVARLFTSQ